MSAQQNPFASMFALSQTLPNIPAPTTTTPNQPTPEKILTDLERLLTEQKFLNYITLLTRIFLNTHTPASCANAFTHILVVHPDASTLHNQLAQLTRVGDSTYNVPEIEDEMFSETTTVVVTRPMEARQVVMQCFGKVRVQIVDVDALLRGMVGLEL